LLAKMVTGQPPQLFVNQWKHCLQCRAVPISPLEEKFADLLGGSWTHFGASGSDTNAGTMAGE
jgi:hypothetical protein